MATILIMFDITAIPAFTDNYLWLLSCGSDAVIVDPGDAAPVLRELETRSLKLRAILITHWHPDHIGGLPALKSRFDVPVYGPRAESQKIPGLTRLLDDGDQIRVLGLGLQVLAMPGHTLGHIAYSAPGLLFCGDTLFSGGCGRLFEGTPAQMHHSLSRLAALPPETRVYCTHEYTLSNLAFARAVEPDNATLAMHIETVKAQRARGEPSLPSTLAIEAAINPFLRADVIAVRAAAARHSGHKLETTVDVFTELRRWKDGFRGPEPL